MTSKEYLSQAYLIDMRINSKLEQIQSLRDLLTRVNNTIKDTPGNPNRDKSLVEEYMVKIVDLEREIDSEIDRLVTLKAEIMRTIQQVPDIECRTLLEERYINMAKWDDIADAMFITTRHMHRIHGKALSLVKIPQCY